MTVRGRQWIFSGTLRPSRRMSSSSKSACAVPCVRSQSLLASKQGAGLFAMGILLSAFFSLDTISDKATDIYNRAEEEISKLDPSTLPPGYLDQAKLLLARLKPGTSNAMLETKSLICLYLVGLPMRQRRTSHILGQMTSETDWRTRIT